MQRERKPHIFAPLGNAAYFRSLGIPNDKVHILDWWDSRRVEVEAEAQEKPSKSPTGSIRNYTPPKQQAPNERRDTEHRALLCRLTRD